jgi:hypothetical protein
LGSFTDGPRPVYVDESGEYTFDDLGERIHGIWYVPPGETEFANVPLKVDFREAE